MKDSSGWKYDNNSAYYPFTPRATRILVAAIDYSADTITGLERESGTVNGITKGYADGTLTFTADMWNGSSNDGEFWITGDAFTPSEATKYYDFNGQRIAMRQDGDLTYLHGDHLGSASLSTSITGSVVSEMRYYAYGETRSGSMATDRQYTGQRRETGLGLYDYNARYYDPYLNRFIQADTIVPEPGNPQSLNRYSYTINNPLRYTDPSGHWYYDEGADALVHTRGDDRQLRNYRRGLQSPTTDYFAEPQSTATPTATPTSTPTATPTPLPTPTFTPTPLPTPTLPSAFNLPPITYCTEDCRTVWQLHKTPEDIDWFGLTVDGAGAIGDIVKGEPVVGTPYYFATEAAEFVSAYRDAATLFESAQKGTLFQGENLYHLGRLLLDVASTDPGSGIVWSIVDGMVLILET